MRKVLLVLSLFFIVFISGACEAPIPISETYRVAFETDGGNQIPSIRVTRDVSMTLPVPQKVGFSFNGWYEDASLSIPFTETDPVSGPMTLYASWQVRVYTVTFDTRGGETIASLELPYGSDLTLPDPTHDSATFGGWFIDASLMNRFNLTVVPDHDLVIYARWLSDADEGYDFLAETPDSQLESVAGLANMLDYMLFNRLTEVTVFLMFDFPDIDTVIDEAFAAHHIQANVSLSFSYLSSTNALTMTAAYSDEAILSASVEPAYRLRPFYFMTSAVSRDESFDAFAIDALEATYPVVTSDQLYYVMEKGYRPVFTQADTPAEMIYEAARAVLRSIIDDSMSDVEKLRVIYAWLVEQVTYDAALLNKLIEGEQNLNRYKGFYLEGVFEDRRAVCDGYSKALVVLGRMEGLEVVRIIGQPADPTNTVLHAWNKVLLGETWHIIDATSGNTILVGQTESVEMFSHAFFLIDETTMSSYYIATSHLNLTAQGGYDIYQHLTFEVDEQPYSRFIDTQEALNAAFRYAALFADSEMTFDVRLAFDYGEDLSSAIQTAMAAADFGSVQYNVMGDVLVFWRS